MENKEKQEAEEKKVYQEEEVSLEDLSKVTGGSGLRYVKKEKTYDISDSVKERI